MSQDAGRRAFTDWMQDQGYNAVDDVFLEKKIAEYVDAAVAEARREERERWNRMKPLDADPTCGGCGGPHPFDTSVPSPLWNRIIRGAGLSDYLCTTCIVKAFVLAGEGFTATLWSPDFNGVALEVIVNGDAGRSAVALGEQNNQLRASIIKVTGILNEVIDEATKPVGPPASAPGSPESYDNRSGLPTPVLPASAPEGEKQI